jgi:hypothetical protein
MKYIQKEIRTTPQQVNPQPPEAMKAVLTGDGGGESIFGTTEWSAGCSANLRSGSASVGSEALGRHIMSLSILVSFGLAGSGRVESLLTCVHSVRTEVRF